MAAVKTSTFNNLLKGLQPPYCDRIVYVHPEGNALDGTLAPYMSSATILWKTMKLLVLALVFRNMAAFDGVFVLCKTGAEER